MLNYGISGKSLKNSKKIVLTFVFIFLIVSILTYKLIVKRETKENFKRSVKLNFIIENFSLIHFSKDKKNFYLRADKCFLEKESNSFFL